MKKKIIALCFGVSFLYTNCLNPLTNVEASTYENQAVVQFYQKEETESSEQNEKGSQPSKIDNQNTLPQTGSAISLMSLLGCSLILLVWLLKKRKEK
ncbi:LPXTG cell wall anchor domain-containing protein [Enterococcus sp. OL5]|uniref:LPXTG cell wall anchor domain-containing protein n=1 Tax=Enterococcus sp. OL5 TaxID=2590214 RepID=UPI00112AC0B6|nr:LPXTG cell wall anchor domain-containing protein [Enterococcus sp. OL5]TPR55160.1 LPXTG cell wall anchor domain-containing protein [Enterococcus sp. OL5]